MFLSIPSCGTFQETMASRSVNKVILVGHLGRDAETKFTPSGVAKTTFSVATSRRWKDQQTGDWKEETDWANIVLWRSENVANYLTKGKQVYVEGRLSTRSYDDKDGVKKWITEVVAEEVILLGGRGGDAPADDFASQGSSAGPVSMPRSARPAPARAQAAAEPAMDQGISDDDVPF
jgi:single-strand DNA-binding protein